MLFNGEQFSDYFVCPNLFPIYEGHVVIINENPDKIKLHPWDLEGMMRLHKEHGYTVWHNKKGSALTIPHEHFQGILLNMPIDKLELRVSNSKFSVMDKYPGANMVFTGNYAQKNAAEAISRLEDKEIYHSIVCTDKIFVVPVKKYQGKGGCGGFEIALGGVELTRNETLSPEFFSSKLKNALFKQEEFELYYLN